MRRLIVKPRGRSCKYREAPPGHIVVGGQLCFKSEYRTENGKIEGYNEAGEFLCIEPDSIVQPVKYTWEEAEE